MFLYCLNLVQIILFSEKMRIIDDLRIEYLLTGWLVLVVYLHEAKLWGSIHMHLLWRLKHLFRGPFLLVIFIYIFLFFSYFIFWESWFQLFNFVNLMYSMFSCLEVQGKLGIWLEKLMSRLTRLVMRILEASAVFCFVDWSWERKSWDMFIKIYWSRI